MRVWAGSLDYINCNATVSNIGVNFVRDTDEPHAKVHFLFEEDYGKDPSVEVEMLKELKAKIEVEFSDWEVEFERRAENLIEDPLLMDQATDVGEDNALIVNWVSLLEPFFEDDEKYYREFEKLLIELLEFLDK